MKKTSLLAIVVCIFAILAFSVSAQTTTLTVSDLTLGSSDQNRGEAVSGIITVKNTDATKSFTLGSLTYTKESKYSDAKYLHTVTLPTLPAAPSNVLAPGAEIQLTVTAVVPLNLDSIDTSMTGNSFKTGTLALVASDGTNTVTVSKDLKIGVVKDFFNGCEQEVQKECMNAVKRLEAKGAKVEEISLPLNAKYGIAAYYLASTTEASTNLARYCGMRYGLHEKLEGNFNEYFSKVRSNGFGEEAKRRILLGTFARMAGFRDAYYLKAMKARTLLIKEFKQAFSGVDVLVNPTMPIVAPKFDEIEKLSPLEQYAMDLCTVPANLAGLPHASVPVGEHKNMPVGLMITADHLQEKKMVQAALAFEGACR